MFGLVHIINVPVIAKSRSKSSELGAFNHSARLASGNSLPMTRVISKNLNWSRIPVSPQGFSLQETAS